MEIDLEILMKGVLYCPKSRQELLQRLKVIFACLKKTIYSTALK